MKYISKSEYETLTEKQRVESVQKQSTETKQDPSGNEAFLASMAKQLVKIAEASKQPDPYISMVIEELKKSSEKPKPIHPFTITVTRDSNGIAKRYDVKPG